jgi:hypothetical protein
MERLLKLDDEVRHAEERIARRRVELAGLKGDLGECTRDAVASPAVLGTAVAVGFVLGKAMRRARREPVPQRGNGLSDLAMAAVWPLVRMSSGVAIETLWNRVFRPRDTQTRPDPGGPPESLPLNPGATERLLAPHRSPL